MNATVAGGGVGGLWGSGSFQTHATSLLRTIVHGSSSTSMNLIRLRRNYEMGHRLFRNALFYRSIIFKYPAEGGPGEPGGSGIGTGIFLPMDIENPLIGGQTIFLDRPPHRRAFMDQLESNRRGAAEMSFDVRLLNLLSSTPTVDPFLVKLLLSNNRIVVSPGALPIQPDEENATAAAISRKLGRVYRHAAVLCRKPDEASVVSAGTTEVKGRILRRLAESCGLAAPRSSDVVLSLEGLSYYEYLYGQTQNRLQAVGVWLNGPAAEPVDLATVPRAEQAGFRQRRMTVTNKLVRTLRSVNEQFGAFNRAIEEFVDNGSPEAFARFVMTNQPRFMRVGFEISAIVNFCAAVERRWATEKGPVRIDDVSASLDLLSQIVSVGADGSKG
ncbi:MAG: hypothetical protein ACK5WM_08485 [Rhodospirillales bacterium]